MKHCGQPDHINPHWDCPHCVKQGGTGFFMLKGGGWTPKGEIYHGDLPPHDEVAAKRKEEGRVTLRSSEQDS